MPKPRSYWALCAASLAGLPAGLAQESPSTSADRLEIESQSASARETCFAGGSILDMYAMNDRHLYVRTRGGNHYLIVTDDTCKHLVRSERRGEARLVPYGRTVCQNDGSYIVSNEGGRELACPILGILHVASRTEAKSIADGNQDSIEYQAVPLEPETDPPTRQRTE